MSQIFLLRADNDIQIMREKDLFTESKNILLKYDASKLGTTHRILGFRMEKTPKNFLNFWGPFSLHQKVKKSRFLVSREDIMHI